MPPARAAVTQASFARHDPRVDAKIAGASAALQPILLHLREVVHEAVPEATETIKWGMPFFEVNGTILANMGIFKHHCSFGFWSRSMTQHLKNDGLEATEGAGSLGKLKSLADLPDRDRLLSYVRLAARHIREGISESPLASRPRKRGPDGNAASKGELPTPELLQAALAASPAAKATFDSFPPGCRREYLAWISEAKREETRARRVQQAVAQMAEGKRHNWQYAGKN